MCIGALFLAFFSLSPFFFFFCFNWSVCDLAWSSPCAKGLEVEKLECHGRARLFQHALGTPEPTPPGSLLLATPSFPPTSPQPHFYCPHHAPCRGVG